MQRFFKLIYAFLWSFGAFALSNEDKLFELEAKINTMQAEVDAAKALASQERPSAFNPGISVIGDFSAQWGFGFNDDHSDHDHDKDDGHSHAFENGFAVNEIELELTGEIDPYARGVIAFAIEPHGRHHAKIHLEEAYVRFSQQFNWWLAPTLTVGKFKTALGRINRVHRHNLPQVDYPLATKAFLGDEGFAAPGISADFNFALNNTSAINVVFEAIIGDKLALQAKGADEHVSGIMHTWWHQELAPEHFLDVGVSALAGRAGKKDSGALFLLGNDIHYSYLPKGYGQDPMFLVGNEFYAATTTSKREWPVGNFTWAQVRLLPGTFLGARYDFAPKADSLSLEHAMGGYLTHYTSEFLRLRLGYEHHMPKISSLDGDHRFMLSAIFVLGNHPVEPYFVNR